MAKTTRRRRTAVQSADETTTRLPLDVIELSQRFNRQAIDLEAPEFRELVASITVTRGPIQPILVRPCNGSGRYELIAGERRFRATREAGFADIPAVVRDVDDQAAGELQLTENHHRQNLTPFEEALQVQALLDAGATTADVASRLGKTRRFVQRRASITRLAGCWRKAAQDPALAVKDWPATHLEMIARLPEGIQEALHDMASGAYWGLQLHAVPDTDDLERHIGRFTHELKRATFKTSDDSLVPEIGACAECEKRSSCSPLLFDELSELEDAAEISKQDRCLDDDCWKRKSAAAAAVKVASLEQKHGALLVKVSAQHPTPAGCVHRHDVYEVKKSTPGAVPVVVVDGEDAGRTFWATRPYGRAATVASAGAPGVKPLAERRQALQKRRHVHAVALLRTQLDEAGVDDVYEANDQGEARDLLLMLVAAFGAASSLDYSADPWADFDGFAKDGDELEHVWSGVKQKISEQITPVQVDRFQGLDEDLDNARRIARLIGADMDALVAEAEVQIPEPKAWANLNEDGTPKTPKGKK